MAIIVKQYTFTPNTLIESAKVNNDFDVIYADYNGNITNANLATGAAITDSKLAQIVTANKVSITALGAVGQAQGDILYYNGAHWVLLHASTAGDILQTNGALANPSWNSTLNALPAGVPIQAVYEEYRTSASTSATIPFDNTIPLYSEGTQFLTATITPLYATSILFIQAVARLTCGAGNGQSCTLSLFQDATGTDPAIAATAINAGTGTAGYGPGGTAVLNFKVATGATTATTFYLRYGANTGTSAVNSQHDYTALFNGKCVSSITITEIKQ